jgi:hypothetical protein
MADERNFIDKAQSIAKLKTGRELTPAEMATEFAVWGVDQRAEYLDSIDQRNKSESHEPLSIAEAARRHAFERGMTRHLVSEADWQIIGRVSGGASNMLVLTQAVDFVIHLFKRNWTKLLAMARQLIIASRGVAHNGLD